MLPEKLCYIVFVTVTFRQAKYYTNITIHPVSTYWYYSRTKDDFWSQVTVTL